MKHTHTHTSQHHIFCVSKFKTRDSMYLIKKIVDIKSSSYQKNNDLPIFLSVHPSTICIRKKQFFDVDFRKNKKSSNIKHSHTFSTHSHSILPPFKQCIVMAANCERFDDYD